jgi:hypothetical protein
MPITTHKTHIGLEDIQWGKLTETFTRKTTTGNLITLHKFGFPWIDVTHPDFGAKGDGVTDDTEAFAAAYAAFPSSGGVIFAPNGKYAMNLTILKTNVTIQGTSNVLDTNINDCLVPWDTTKPVIQIGNDTGYVRGTKLKNLTLYGTGPNGVGQQGLALMGGAYQTFIDNFAANRFSAYDIYGISGATYPVVYTFFSKYQTVANSTTTASIGLFNGPQYLTAIYFVNGNISGPLSSGYTMILDSVIIGMENSWLEMQNGLGVKFQDNYSIAPIFHGSNVTLDSSASTDVLVETYNKSKVISDIFQGNISIDGYMKLSDGDTVDCHTVRMKIPYLSQLHYPISVGSHYFTDINNPNTVTKRIYASGSNIVIENADGAFFIRPKSGSVLELKGSLYPEDDKTYYLGKNSNSSPLAWKGVILKDTTNGHYYRIEVINGVITATDLGT